MNQKVTRSFFEKHEFLIPIFLFIIFLAFTLPGIALGAPDTWHPDEIVIRSLNALEGDNRYNEVNFDYPALPQNVMIGLGRLVFAFGYDDVILPARILSAVLAGLTVILAYTITRRAGGNVYASGLGGLLLISASAMPHNGRFAHNDTYLTFFVALAVLFLVKYRVSYQRAWLYASFLAVGMAASSKYNGISLVLAPALVYMASRRRAVFTLRTLETLVLGGALTFGGYVIGTSQALTSMSFYFKRMIPALLHTGNYLRQPDSVRGYIGQYASFIEAVGLPLFGVFALALVWAGHRVYRAYILKKGPTDARIGALALLLLAILALDIPIMISYNYPARFFLPMLPLFAALGALTMEELQRFVPYQRLLGIALLLVIPYSLTRNVSVMLLFQNDSRLPASEYLRTLPVGTSLEHTYYPPSIPAGHFEREHNYPIYFRKAADEPLPTSRLYEFNAGEAGLDERGTDYFVVDSFTTDKFEDPHTCADMQVECDFFRQLATGQSEHYKLIAEFSYTLPRGLPQLTIDFVNPAIRIYERMP